MQGKRKPYYVRMVERKLRRYPYWLEALESMPGNITADYLRIGGKGQQVSETERIALNLLEIKQNVERVERVFKKLAPVQQDIIRQLYFEDLTLYMVRRNTNCRHSQFWMLWRDAVEKFAIAFGYIA